LHFKGEGTKNGMCEVQRRKKEANEKKESKGNKISGIKVRE
jgi:hypothetical protein